jgi:hypothetical protein
MVKRKSSTTGELRTSPIVLGMTRVPTIQLNAWDIKHSQTFFPPLESLFKTESLSHVNQYGIRFSDPISAVPSEDVVRLLSGKTVNVHRKSTMLLSPFKWMKGEFGHLGLPTSKSNADEIHSKLQSPNTAGYVGSILSVALSHSGCLHFPKVYGVFTGTSTKHVINISDDYEDLSERKWFSQNIGKTFQIALNEHVGNTISYTRNARDRILIGDDVELGDVEELAGVPTNVTEAADMNAILHDHDSSQEDDDLSSMNTSYVFNIESIDTDAFSESESISVEEEEDEPFAWATFENVPVQTTVMEKCMGLFYMLLKEDTNTEHHMAWFSQIIFALAFAQRNFAFTHNDLHANNVMYVPTEDTHLYYMHAGVYYAVPTYGYLIKIIDFDRSIGSVRLPGMKEPKLFMSDHFSADEEAGGQYNTFPFYVSKYPIVKPNPSFDLVRLATSLFWDLFPNGPKYDEYQNNEVFRMFMRWMTLEDGTHILFHKTQPKMDRYPGFHLYKAIARYCKDTAVPRKEIAELKQYIVSGFPVGHVPLVIDV